VLVAGKEGVVHILNSQYSGNTKIELIRYDNKTNLESISYRIRAMDSFDGKRILVGTYSSEIVEFFTNDLRLTVNTKYDKREFNKGVFAWNSYDKFETWGLAVAKGVNPDYEGKFLTCGDDGILRVWNLKERRLEWLLDLNTNNKGDQVIGTDDTKLRAISLSPKEDVAAIGCKSGAIKVASINLDRQPPRHAPSADDRRHQGPHPHTQVLA
jgi:WD40 repeat protein